MLSFALKLNHFVMKRILSLILSCFAFAQIAFAQTSGGPDLYGYTFRTDQAADGPTYEWIDISQTGTNVTGLGDDNFVGPFNMGINFPFYWNSYDRVFIGSNGYIMFGRGSTFASSGGAAPGFPIIPTTGATNNNFVAGYLADLTFVRADGGAPIPAAKCVYQTIGTKFICSFLEVPFWSQDAAAGPGQFSGAATFQMILDAADSSIVINYQNLTGPSYSGYVDFARGGIENITGQVGLMTLSNPTLPTTNQAVKFYYPRNTTYQFRDAGALGAFNEDNQGIVVPRGSIGRLKGAVRNFGTADITSNISVRINVILPNNQIAHRDTVILAGLPKGKDTLISFPKPFTNTALARTFSATIITTLTGDQLTSNNTVSGELVVSDSVNRKVNVFFANSVYPDAIPSTVNPIIAFDVQSAGMKLDAPSYPSVVENALVDLFWTDSTYAVDFLGAASYSDSIMPIRVEVRSDDGPNGSAGTLLNSFNITHLESYPGELVKTIRDGSEITSVVKRFELPMGSYLWTAGSLYVGVFQELTTNFVWNSLLRHGTGPFSFRALELPGGVYGQHRTKESLDFPIGLQVQYRPLPTNTSDKKKKDISSIRLYPNPAQNSLNIVVPTTFTGLATIEFVSASGASFKFPAVAPQNGKLKLDVSEMPEGIYTLLVKGQGQVYQSRFVKN